MNNVKLHRNIKEAYGKENEVHICFNNIDIPKYFFLSLTRFQIMFFINRQNIAMETKEKNLRHTSVLYVQL